MLNYMLLLVALPCFMLAATAQTDDEEACPDGHSKCGDVCCPGLDARPDAQPSSSNKVGWCGRQSDPCQAGKSCCPNGDCCDFGKTCCGRKCCNFGKPCCGGMCCDYGSACCGNKCC